MHAVPDDWREPDYHGTDGEGAAKDQLSDGLTQEGKEALELFTTNSEVRAQGREDYRRARV